MLSVAFSFREEGSFPPVFPSKMRAPASFALARRNVSSGALTTGTGFTNLALGFRQSSLHPVMQVLRNHDFCAFSSSAAFPPCCGPLCLLASGKAADLWNSSSISRPLMRQYEESCHGARSTPGYHDRTNGGLDSPESGQRRTCHCSQAPSRALKGLEGVVDRPSSSSSVLK
jgi:hypothetical protein